MRRGPKEEVHGAPLRCGESVEHHWIRASSAAGSPLFVVRKEFAAAEHGLAALAGSSHDVGVLGYTLGGGISWLARKHGLSANAVVSADIVEADGNARTIDWSNDPDLFWAIRGGGGSFAVVTALWVGVE